MIKKMQKEMKEKDQQIKSYNDSKAEMNAYTAEKEESNKKEKALTGQRDPLRRQCLFMWRNIHAKLPLVKRKF